MVVSTPSIDIFAERAPEPHEAFVARLAEHDELADQAVVVGRNSVAGIDRRIDPHAKSAGHVHGIDASGRGRKGSGIFGVDAAFDGMARKCDVVLAVSEARSRRDADLFLDEIETGQHFGHRMFDLQARIHLDEIEGAILVQELDGSDTGVAELRHGLGDALADRGALGGVEGRRGRLLPHLLVSTLQRAIAFAEVNGLAAAVAQHLNLDVARLFEILFDIDAVVAEGCCRPPPGPWRGRLRTPLRCAPPSCRGRRRPPSP